MVDFNEILSSLRNEYIQQVGKDISLLISCLKEGSFDEPDLRNIAHKIRGSAGTYGIPELSELAAKAEDELKKEKPSGELLKQIGEEMEKLYDKLKIGDKK